jgi:DNA-binding MarR family transcriptional regulator
MKSDVNVASRARSGARSTATSPAQAGPEPAIHYGALPSLVGHHVRKAYSRLFQSFTEALGELGLAPGQFSALMLIGLNPGLSQMALADAAGIDGTTMVPITNRFAKAGWVRRARRPEDRRVYSLRLTPEGKAVLAKARPLVEAYEKKFTAVLSAAERAKLRELLARIADAEGARAPGVSPRGRAGKRGRRRAR